MLLLVASALLAASPEPSGTVAAPLPVPAPVAKPKKICRVEQAVTGSITPKRVCVTVPADPAPRQKLTQDASAKGSTTASGGTNN